MWESRVRCEISKSLWTALFAIHRDVISIARHRHDSSVTSSALGLLRRPSNPAFRFSFSR
jgi:hypothetical protein